METLISIFGIFVLCVVLIAVFNQEKQSDQEQFKLKLKKDNTPTTSCIRDEEIEAYEFLSDYIPNNMAVYVDGYELSSVYMRHGFDESVTIDGVKYSYRQPLWYSKKVLKSSEVKALVIKAYHNKPKVVASRHSIICDKLQYKDSHITSTWYELVGHNIFLITPFSYLDLEDCKVRTITPEVSDLVINGQLVPCEDPYKTHWKVFLKCEMEAKKAKEDACIAWVDSILTKQQEYNDLQLTYEMLPSVPIVDYVTFENFCKLVHEPINYKSCLISNILLSKGLKPH